MEKNVDLTEPRIVLWAHDATDGDRELVGAIERGISAHPDTYERVVDYYMGLLDASTSDNPSNASESFIMLFNEMNKDLVTNNEFIDAYANILRFFKSRLDIGCEFDQDTEIAISNDPRMKELRDKIRSSGLLPEEQEVQVDINRAERLKYYVGRIARKGTRGKATQSMQETA